MSRLENTISRCAILLILCALSLIVASCGGRSPRAVWTAEDGNILKNGRSEYFVGTNLWYAGRLAKDEAGRARLVRELDTLKAMGVTNLRVLAVEGEDLAGLEYALDRMEERGMCAVLFLNNAWEWSHGFADYMEAAGAGRQPRPATEGYSAYMQAMAGFSTNDAAISLNHDYIRRIVPALKDHPAIFSWQICNEPRCFSDAPVNRDAFVRYIHSTAALIKSLDPVHMVSTGNEGRMGCEGDMSLCRRINDCDDIDYITLHIWPYNWGWVMEDSVKDGVSAAIQNVGRYIDEHLDMAARLGKPLIIEEFGYPRDGFAFDRECPTSGRDSIYSYVFSRIIDSASRAGNLAGCNFWGWGGFAEPAHEMWQEGDDLCGDPAQEAQGLNSVFSTDATTLQTIVSATEKLSSMARLRYEFSSGHLFTGKGRRALRVEAVNPSADEMEVRMALVSDLSLMSETKDTVLLLSKSVKGESANLDFPLDGVAPGFYQVNLSWESDGLSGSYAPFNIGIDPEEIVSPQDKRPDFDEFWGSTLAELAAIPMDVVMEFSPEHSNSQRNSYRVEITSFGGEKMGGLLCEPVKEGSYPVYIDYMGYGGDTYWYDPSSNPEAIEFLVSVRDQGIFRADNSRWIDRGLDSKENFYYRGAFCDVVRAVDFVASLDKADTSHLFARGESQGGAFTLISASLDPRIAAAAPSVPFLGDYRHYSQIVWWPVWEVFEEADRLGIGRESLFETLSYFDVKNFTDRIKCPVYMAFGLQDPVCPPHTNFAGYNMIESPKKYLCVPGCGHAMWMEEIWQQEKDRWFRSMLETTDRKLSTNQTQY